MDMTWVNPVEVLQQWIKECSHIQFCWFCRQCSSYSQERLPLFRVTVSGGTWLFSMSSCIHVNSLLDCAESFSSVVFFGFGEPHRELPFLIIFCGGKSCALFLWNCPWDCLPKLCGIPCDQKLWSMYFSSFLIGTFWSLLSPIKRSLC